MSNVNGIWLPNTHTWRDLWLARNDVAAEMRQSVPKWQYQMHQIDLNNMIPGQEKRTTCEGVHFDGANTGNVNLGAVYNGATKFWMSFRFKFDQTYSSAMAANQYIWGKYDDVNNFIWAGFHAIDGKLHFYMKIATVERFDIETTQASWTAGTWYYVIFSISSANAVRLIVDNGTPVTDADTNAIPGAGDLIIGDYDDPGLGTGFKGVITDVYIGSNASADDLTTQEETNLYLGVPPVDAEGAYRLTEGKESTAYDEGSGGNDGTLDTTATWAWGGCRQPVIGFAGIDQWGRTPAFQKGNGDLTMAWVGKLKSPYLGLANSMNYAMFCNIWIDADNRFEIYYDQANDDIRLLLEGSGTTINATGFTSPFSYNDYAVFLATCGVDGSIRLFANGELVAYNSGAGAVPGINGRFNLMATSGGSNFNVSDVLACGVINGIVNTDEAREITKVIDDTFNMGVKLL